jgi:hypothetical protein
MARSGGVMNLQQMVPRLPKVRLVSGREVQLMHFTAEGYEMWTELRALVADSESGIEVDTIHVEELTDQLLRKVLPDATPDDLAAFGSRLEAKMAPIMAAAGQVDAVMAALEALDEGNGEMGQSKPPSDPPTKSAPQSSGTHNGSGKIGKGRTPAPPSRGSSSRTGAGATTTDGSD